MEGGRGVEVGWDFAGPGVGMPAGVGVIGYRDVGGVGLDLRVAGAGWSPWWWRSGRVG